MNESTVRSCSLSGKVALVTGAARGIGAGVSRQLACLGAHVIVAARDMTRAEALATELREEGHLSSALQLDVTSDADRKASYAWIGLTHGKLDILINNAGVWLDSANAATPADRPPSEASQRVLRETFEANFFAPIFLTQALLPLLRRSDAGRIVNVSSIRGSLTHLSDPTSLVYQIKALAYDSSKTALNAFTVVLAEELRGTSIKVNAIHPGWVRTAMGSDGADMSVEEGACIAVQYASLDGDGPTGGFFFHENRLPW